MGVELALVVVVAIALIIAVAITGTGSVDNLTSRGVTENAPDYFAVGGGLMLAMIMGLATLVGFDAAANLAEEAKDPFRTVPRAIVGSVVAAGVLGLLFLIALTVAIDDIPRISASDSPVAAIMRDQLGPVMETALLVAITFAFFGAGMVMMATCARLVFAMSRDSPLPRPPADAAGQPAHADADPGDDPDFRPRGRPDGRAAGRRAAAADHGVDDPAGAHLRGDDHPLPGGAQAAGTQEGRVRSRALRVAGRDRRAGLAVLALFVLVTPGRHWSPS